MNTGSSTLKVTVNGKKYLITGIERETSCKGLLCAIAKVTSQEETTIQKYGLPNENLLERFKGDRKLAGDLTSLNVFNSLAKDAKIIAKETVTVHKELIIDDSALQVQHSSSKQHKNSKKQKHNKESKKEKDSLTTTKKEKDSKESKKDKESKKEKHKDSKKDKDKEEKRSKHKHRNKKETFTLTTTKTTETKVKHKIKHRSVDDSDIETYKRDSLRRLHKSKRRVYDDSDIEVYKTLQNIVVDQSKKLSRIQLHTREVKRTAWMKELKRNSQIYYLDDRPSTTLPNDSCEMVENAACSFEKDDGNDSGLPSPEYDSSESHENQPIKIKEASALLCDNNNNNNTKYQIAKSTKAESKHSSIVSNKNNKEIKQLQDGTLPNQTSTKILNNENSSNSTSESISVRSANRLNNETQEKSISEGIKKESEKHDNETSTQRHDEEGSLPAFVLLEKTDKDISGSNTFTDKGAKKSVENTSQTSPVDEQQDYKNMMIDKNKNILKDSDACEKEVSKMVAFNEALFKASTATTTTSNGISKKIEKKKFKKSDISQPVLLSPSTLKKHHNVKKVQSVLGKQAADVLRQDVVKSLNGVSTQTASTKEVTKEKEKYFNKKLKEIRSKTSKKLKTPPTSSRGEDPEYFSKKQFTKDSSTSKFPSTNDPEKSTTKTSSTNSVTVTNHKSLNHENSTSKLINDPHKSNNLEIDVQMKSSTTSDGNESPRKNTTPKCKQQNETIDNTNKSDDLTEETVLKADEILNEILEYEKNIKNELDQIIQCDDNEKKNNNKSELEVKAKGVKSKTKIVSELSTKTNEPKQINNTSTKILHSKQSNNNIVPTVNENSIATRGGSVSNGLNVVKAENLPTMRGDEEQERFDLIEKYLEEKQALEEISEKLSEYNYALCRLKEEISMFDLEENEPKTLSELNEEEQHVYKEIANVKGLLKSVADLTTYQRKEMTDNMEAIDQIDLENRTLKANFDNLRSGSWRTNSKSAPRSLIKNAKVKRRNSNKQGFV